MTRLAVLETQIAKLQDELKILKSGSVNRNHAVMVHNPSITSRLINVINTYVTPTLNSIKNNLQILQNSLRKVLTT